MAVATDELRAQIDRLVQSKTFETSEVHRRLLVYLADKTFAGEAERLKEYTIGLEAFGKPSSYDPKHDSIVRIQVSRLRQKLMAYYQTEGTGDPVLVGLPKGAFKITFEEPQAAPPGPVAIADIRQPRTSLYLSIVLAVVTLWAILATAAYFNSRKDSAVVVKSWTPELQALWEPFLQSERPVLISLGTPLFIRFPNFGFFRDAKVNEWQDIAQSDRMKKVMAALGDKDLLPNYHFTGSGEATAAFLLSRLLSTRKSQLSMTPSNILSWQQVVDNNVVFVGPPKFNLHLQATALREEIVVEPSGIRNLKPHPGEPAFLEDRIAPGKQSEGETHAIISRIPGLSGVGDCLVLAGNASPDTFAAAEWLTQPWRAAELVKHLRGPNGAIPRHFQVVLKVAFKQGIPVKSSYVFHHVLAR